MLLLTCSCMSLFAQSFQEPWASYAKRIEAERAQTDSIFRVPNKSPLDSENVSKFSGLEYFPLDSSFRVTAKLYRNKKRPKFEMPTSTDRLPVYRRHGKLIFQLSNTQCTLQVYQNVRLSKKDGYQDYLFVPFTDLTSGAESYGGGRYLDLRLNPKLKEVEIIIDFNLAYNPYCAYGSRWSCPIPPKENDLPVRVEAGVRAFGEH